MSGKTAIIIGATGLVGNHLLLRLLNDDQFDNVKIFVRTSTGIKHPKLNEHVINFDKKKTYKKLVTGDVLFSCLGTTRRQAKTKAKQYKVDYTYQYQFAKMASKNKVPSYVLVSSSSANKNSRLFYFRMKGELEVAVRDLKFSHIHIVRPSIIDGKRCKIRIREKLAAKLSNISGKIIPRIKKYRSIKGIEVATALHNIYNQQSDPGVFVYKLDELFNYQN